MAGGVEEAARLTPGVIAREVELMRQMRQREERFQWDMARAVEQQRMVMMRMEREMAEAEERHKKEMDMLRKEWEEYRRNSKK
jgi:hypothetical protein